MRPGGLRRYSVIAVRVSIRLFSKSINLLLRKLFYCDIIIMVRFLYRTKTNFIGGRKMEIEKIEHVLYLVRINLFGYDDDGNHFDWRDSKVVGIMNNVITLRNGDEIKTWDIDELIQFCEELCEEHFRNDAPWIK
jgi:hypothetical protein